MTEVVVIMKSVEINCHLRQKAVGVRYRVVRDIGYYTSIIYFVMKLSLALAFVVIDGPCLERVIHLMATKRKRAGSLYW